MYIEKNVGETLFQQYFYSCRTLELTSNTGEKRRFVEISEPNETCLASSESPLKIAIKNAIRKLLREQDNQYFYSETDQDVLGPFVIGGKEYYVKCFDSTESWPNHYWVRTKHPIIGFKAISADGTSALYQKVPTSIPYASERRYREGQTYHITDKEYLCGAGKGFFFSPTVSKALQYYKSNQASKMCLVAASGIVFVKNSWDDLCASRLTIIEMLSEEAIQLILKAK